MQLQYVSDISDARLEVFQNLTNHQLRNYFEVESGIFICESEIALRVAFEQGLEPVSLLLEENKIESLSDVLEMLPDACPIFVMSRDIAESLIGYRWVRGVLGAFVRPKTPSLDSILQSSRTIAVLEGLVDASNVGAIFRSAAALGIDGIVCTATCADPYVRRCVRTSMGCVLKIPFAKLDTRDTRDLFLSLSHYSYRSYALALSSDACSISDLSKTVNCNAGGLKHALFLGSEGYGLTSQVLNQVDQKLIIPMHNNVDSLNVAVAASLAFWEFSKL